MAIHGSQAPKIDGVGVEVAVVSPCDELLYDEEDEDARDEVLDQEESAKNVMAGWVSAATEGSGSHGMTHSSLCLTQRYPQPNPSRTYKHVRPK